jgi:hypothetical protein
VAGDDQPGPPVRGGGVADLRGGPAEDLLEQAEGVPQVKAAQERLPGAVHLARGGAGAGVPQPDRLGVPVAGQVTDLQPDQGSVDDGQVPIVIEPGGAVGQPRVQPVPCLRFGGAVAGGERARGDLRGRPRARVGQRQFPAVLARPAFGLSLATSPR